jgi:hypothetical protein
MAAIARPMVEMVKSYKGRAAVSRNREAASISVRENPGSLSDEQL